MSDDVVQEAIKRLPEILRKSLYKDLCTCNQVPKIDIIDAIAHGADTLAEVRKKTYASMGSACCKQQIERLIECIHPDQDSE